MAPEGIDSGLCSPAGAPGLGMNTRRARCCEKAGRQESQLAPGLQPGPPSRRGVVPMIVVAAALVMLALAVAFTVAVVLGLPGARPCGARCGWQLPPFGAVHAVEADALVASGRIRPAEATTVAAVKPSLGRIRTRFLRRVGIGPPATATGAARFTSPRALGSLRPAQPYAAPADPARPVAPSSAAQAPPAPPTAGRQPRVASPAAAVVSRSPAAAPAPPVRLKPGPDPPGHRGSR